MRTCTICSHPQRSEIEKVIIARGQLQEIAKQFGVSRYAVARHKDHVVQLLARSPAGEQFGEAESLVGSIISLEKEMDAIFISAKLSKDHKTCMAVINRKQRLLEFRAKVSGELKHGAQTNVLTVHVGGKEGLNEGLKQLLARTRFLPVEQSRANEAVPAPSGE